MKMKIIKTGLAVLTLAVFGLICVSSAQADEWNKKTVMTFSQPVEIPGQVLPAGTYTIKLVDIASERHVVQFLDADGIHVIATVLAINNWRLHPTGETVVKFAERAGDNPEALKAWFFPGDNFGQEFVYPKTRAVELAVAEKAPVPSADNTADLNSTPVVAETPAREEQPVEQAFETAPPVAQEEAPAPMEAPAPAKELPHTASSLPLIGLLGLLSLGLAIS